LEKVLVSKMTTKGKDTAITCLRLASSGSTQQPDMMQISEVDDEPGEAGKLEG
jgi:hypothetical protein